MLSLGKDIVEIIFTKCDIWTLKNMYVRFKELNSLLSSSDTLVLLCSHYNINKKAKTFVEFAVYYCCIHHKYSVYNDCRVYNAYITYNDAYSVMNSSILK